jgi:hypothetical protein
VDWENMARIYTLSRFIRTLPVSMANTMKNHSVKNHSVQRAVASVMKVSRECLGAVVVLVGQTGKVFDQQLCENVLQTNQKTQTNSGTPSDARIAAGDNEFTLEAMEALGMLSVFLKRDRTTLSNAPVESAAAAAGQDWSFFSSKILIDCAMYCGEVRWLPKEDEDEDGLWTCLTCLHRWQKRGPCHAYQPRKLLHPMKMTPFARTEYYDPKEWDAIMEATKGDIGRLGRDFYWGSCACGRLCQAVPRSGACAETDGMPLLDFPETCTLSDGSTVRLRQSLKALGDLGLNRTVRSDVLEKYFDSEEKLMYVPDHIRRRTRNCIDKSTYIVPPDIACDRCSVVNQVDDFCPYCGTGFQPIFGCLHYNCPRCNKHFCKACHGIHGLHFNGVYNASSHVCWALLGNRSSYQNKGQCATCGKERPWPESHALKSAGPEIMAAARTLGQEMELQTAIQLQAGALAIFTDKYNEGVRIFKTCSHTESMGWSYCRCGAGGKS